MIRHHVAQQIEPEDGELGEHAAFVGNRGRQHVVEGGKPVRGDDDQEIAGVVNVAHFAAHQRLDAGQVGFKQGCQYLVLSRNGDGSHPAS